MFLCCNRSMMPIWRGPNCDGYRQVDYRCGTCAYVMETAGTDVIVCGRCGMETCEHNPGIEMVNVHPDIRIPPGMQFHYEGDKHWYGTVNGRDYELAVEDGAGEPKRITSVAYRERVVESARVTGAATASRKSGIPAPTIRQWMKRAA